MGLFVCNVAVCAGLRLTVRAGAINTWKPVYFVLQHDKLFWFKSKGDKLPKGCIVLKGSFISATKKVNRPWAFEVSDSRNGKVYIMQAASKADLDSWLDALDKASKHNPVSGPITVAHKVHVDFDTENGFSGLPSDWEELLKVNGITPQAYQSPQEAEREVEVLMKVFEATTSGGDIPIGKALEPAPLPEDHNVTLEDLVNKADPTTIYTDIVKIGEGAAGEVFSAVDTRPGETKGQKVAIKQMPLNGENAKLLVTETCSPSNRS